MDFKEKKSVKNPYVKANPISKLFFWWIFPLFRRGSKGELSVDDCYDVLKTDESGRLGDQLENAWNAECAKAGKAGRRPKFYKALFAVFLKQYAIVGLFYTFNECVVRVAQTLFLQKLISSFMDESTPIRDQYLYGTGIVLCTLVYILIVHPGAFRSQHVGMKARVASCSIIYRKALRLSKAAQGQTTVGQLVNLLSNDVNRFDANLLLIHYVYTGPIQMGIFLYLLWTVGELGNSCLAGAGFIILLVPLQYYIGKMFTVYRLQIAQRTDKRGQIMNEIIIAMRVIKMYAWEKPFTALVDELRRAEVKVLKKAALLRGFYLSLFVSSSKLITFFTLLAYLLQGGELRSDRVFFMVSAYNIVRQMMIQFLPQAAAQIGELYVSVNRIEAFLLLDEKKPTDALTVFKPYLTESSGKDTEKEKRVGRIMDPSVVMTDVSASWTGDKTTLDTLNLNLRGDRLVMVIGPVGSGKTSFLHALISELPITQGKCVINGRTSYDSQEAWIFSGNLYQNILFGRPYDKEKYLDVIYASALEEDLKQLPFGENTIVGERGTALSGGQKARVNLARALYQDADIYLLDDPLSAVDARVSRHIFEKCVRNHLKGKLRILVTHQLQYLPQADHIIVFNEGRILSQGTYKELVDEGIDFVSLLASETEEDTKKKDSVAKLNKEEVPTENKEERNDDKPEAKEESMAGGSVTGKTYWEYYRSGPTMVGFVLMILGFLLSQVVFSGSDYWLSLWTRRFQEHKDKCDKTSYSTPTTPIPTTVASSLGSFLDARNAEDDVFDDCVDSFDRDLYFYVYAGIIVVIFLSTKASRIYFFQYCMGISINIHNKMFSCMVRAPTKFFDDNPSGRIMNRFTKDIGAMDELLPPAFVDAAAIFLQMIGVTIVVIMANYYIALPAVLLVAALVFMRQFFIKTARHVKRIESITRSPVFTHLAATVQGLTTIRSSGSEKILIDQFDGHQDLHSSAWFIFIASNRWFGIWLEMCSLMFLAFVTYSFMVLSGLVGFDGSQVGLAISNSLALTGVFQWGMRQSAETENLMTSVERALEYSKLTPEAPLDSKPDKKPPKNWPTEGAIRLKNMYLAYEDKDVLKDLTFDIKAKEKIGIVGRTGAGKSSIVAGLFRMTEPRGDIFIDGIRINDIGLHDLRKIISIIPQDPVLFSGTIRYNLDPFNQFEDSQLWKVIEEVELKDSVPALDFQVSDGGSNFSVGQRQLVCLARAILRQNKIIVMDEATANVDPRTDNFIQSTIRSKFAQCSIITIAHRLHSVMDCDRILVLDNGYLKEYDHPHVLLQNANGILTSMVGHTGKSSSEILRKVARETFSGRRLSFQADNISLLSVARGSVSERIPSSSSEDEMPSDNDNDTDGREHSDIPEEQEHEIPSSSASGRSST